MTREEAVKQLTINRPSTYTELRQALDIAINSLEQENALDKIRAEIEEEYDNCYICEWYEDYDYEENDISEYQSVGTVSDILEIIDKYKAKSEDKK